MAVQVLQATDLLLMLWGLVSPLARLRSLRLETSSIFTTLLHAFAGSACFVYVFVTITLLSDFPTHWLFVDSLLSARGQL